MNIAGEYGDRILDFQSACGEFDCLGRQLAAVTRRHPAVGNRKLEIGNASDFVYRSTAMDLIAAQQLARRLMQEHGLAAWKFEFDRASRRFGSCSVGRRTITLSWKLTMLNVEAQVRNTLLHEIAHALTPGDGHGSKWKRACIALGIEPQRCFTEKDVAIPARRQSLYEIGCEKCSWWHPRHRLGNRQMICKTCRGTVLYRERTTGRRFRIGSGKVVWLDQSVRPSRSA